MKIAGFTLALASVFAGTALAQAPSVGGLLNNYSFTLPGLPNYGIAQGSIFDIFGTNLAGTSTPLQNPPLQTSLNGVSISVTVNGTVTSPLIYFVSPGQIAAILPSATPVGNGTLTVATAAGTSAPFPIQVVQTAFGLLTHNSGTGPVAGYNASNKYAALAFSAAANPGDILELWGTGLGPVDGDAVAVAVNTPIEVDIGGVAATVKYHGRSGYAGLDQINVAVPQGVSGCNLSVVVVSGNNVSNFGTLAVAPSGRVCSDPQTGVSADILNILANSASFSGGFISLSKSTSPGTTIGGITVGGGTVDTGSASFTRFTKAQFNAGAFGGLASIGNCNILTFNGQTPPATFTGTSLNAGPVVNLNGPNGALAMTLQTVDADNFYSTPSSVTSFIPDTGGTFNFDNGNGGPDVGGFKVTLVVPTPLVWSNMSSISNVTRSAGLTVTWTGGDPSTFVTITGSSFESLDADNTQIIAGVFTCLAPVAPGTFTVPSAVLLSLPPSTVISQGGINLSLSTLAVGNTTNPVIFSAPNLDVGIASATTTNSTSVVYQ